LTMGSIHECRKSLITKCGGFESPSPSLLN
jgi:hypothetical protein